MYFRAETCFGPAAGGFPGFQQSAVKVATIELCMAFSRHFCPSFSQYCPKEGLFFVIITSTDSVFLT